MNGLTSTETSILGLDRPQVRFKGFVLDSIPEYDDDIYAECDRCGRMLTETESYELGDRVYCHACYTEVREAQKYLANEIYQRGSELIQVLLAMTLYKATELELDSEYEDLTEEDIDDILDFMEGYCSDHKEAFIKVLKTISSCQTREQLNTARRYVDLYHDMVGYRIGLLYKLLHKKSADIKSAPAVTSQKETIKNL